MNASNFGVYRSRVKITVGSNMFQTALFGFVACCGGVIVDGVIVTIQFSCCIIVFIVLYLLTACFVVCLVCHL